MKYRSRNEIIRAILNVTLNPVSQTKIMFHAELSYAQLKEYLGYMEDHGLIKKTSGCVSNRGAKTKTGFEISEKGKHYLGTLNDMDEMLSDRSKQIGKT